MNNFASIINEISSKLYSNINKGSMSTMFANTDTIEVLLKNIKYI